MLRHLEDRLRDWLRERDERRLERNFGSICRCPWCRQWLQAHGSIVSRAPDIPQFDVFVCGNCGGSSVWEFGPGIWMLRGQLSAPEATRPYEERESYDTLETDPDRGRADDGGADRET